MLIRKENIKNYLQTKSVTRNMMIALFFFGRNDDNTLAYELTAH